MHSQTPVSSFFGRSRLLLTSTLILIFGLGLGLRFYYLTNPPLDLHAWRQLRSASIARHFYYQLLPPEKLAAIQPSGDFGTFDRLEPNINEWIVALTYRIAGGEYLWIARLYSILYWTIGGIALFALARRMTNLDGALVALAYYFLLPYGGVVSRAFLPEPFMVMWLLLAAYAAYRWTEVPSWRWALLTGVFAGLAVLVKVFAAFPIIAGLVFLVLASWGPRRSLANLRVWAAASLTAIIPAFYYIFPNPGSGGTYLTSWTLPFAHLWTDWTFYISWLNKLNTNFNLAVVLAALASILLLNRRARALCLGLWIGYFLIGMSVPSLITSHIYYNLPLVPVVALSLAPLGALFFSRLAQESRFWQVAFAAVALMALGYTAFLMRKGVKTEDFWDEPQRWRALAQIIPADARLIGLTDDYNMRMMYYGRRGIVQYPHSFDQDMHILAGGNFDPNAENRDYFLERTSGSDMFVITLLDELDKQPYLKKNLYDHYPIFSQGEDYLVFDLRAPH